MQRESEKIYDFVVVTNENKYSGIVTVKDLLEKVIEIEFVNAKHLNPLSELPGNIIIEKQLEMAIDASNNSYVLYFDLDNFKAYNDIYGFKNGDRVLKSLTQLLKRIIPVGEFIGHIGGDDFISIISDTSTHQISKIKELCRNIIEEFDRSVLYFYNQDDIDKGSIITKNRYGIEESFPLLSISISGVASEDYLTIYELTEAVAKLKKACKQKVGSNHMIGDLRLLNSDIAG
jgi:GGDEF domain-containing protein